MRLDVFIIFISRFRFVRGYRCHQATRTNRPPRRRPGVATLLRRWETTFRSQFARDDTEFEALIDRFNLDTRPDEVLAGTVDFVRACAVVAELDGAGIDAFLADQRYEASSGTAPYALIFDVFGSAARLLVQADMRGVDLGGLFEFPWMRLEFVGFNHLIVARTDGEDLSFEELDALTETISRDLRFDFSENELAIAFDPDCHEGGTARHAPRAV